MIFIFNAYGSIISIISPRQCERKYIAENTKNTKIYINVYEKNARGKINNKYIASLKLKKF